MRRGDAAPGAVAAPERGLRSTKGSATRLGLAAYPAQAAQRSRPVFSSFSEYADLCAVEPALIRLLLGVMAAPPTTDGFYQYIKPALTELAGWSAKNPALRTCDAYDCVYSVLYTLVRDP